MFVSQWCLSDQKRVGLLTAERSIVTHHNFGSQLASDFNAREVKHTLGIDLKQCDEELQNAGWN